MSFHVHVQHSSVKLWSFLTLAFFLQIKGFDRFIMRLDHWGISYVAFEVSKEDFDQADILTPREAFKLLKITPPPPKDIE